MTSLEYVWDIAKQFYTKYKVNDFEYITETYISRSTINFDIDDLLDKRINGEYLKNDNVVLECEIKPNSELEWNGVVVLKNDIPIFLNYNYNRFKYKNTNLKKDNVYTIKYQLI